MMIIVIIMVVSHEFCHLNCIHTPHWLTCCGFPHKLDLCLGHGPNQQLKRDQSATRRHVLNNKTSKRLVPDNRSRMHLLVCLGELIGGGEISGMEQNDPKTHSNNKTQNFRQQNTTMDTLLLRLADSRRDLAGWLESYCKLLYFQCPPRKLGMSNS